MTRSNFFTWDKLGHRNLGLWKTVKTERKKDCIWQKGEEKLEFQGMPRVADWLEKTVQKGALEKVWEKEGKKKKVEEQQHQNYPVIGVCNTLRQVPQTSNKHQYCRPMKGLPLPCHKRNQFWTKAGKYHLRAINLPLIGSGKHKLRERLKSALKYIMTHLGLRELERKATLNLTATLISNRCLQMSGQL